MSYRSGETLQEYILARCIPVPDAGRWIWLENWNYSGYGMGNYHGFNTPRAHKLSWIAFRGKVPKGLVVCHKCNVRCCVNPEHLYIGTMAQNNEDCRRKVSEAYAKKLECLHGHPLTGPDAYYIHPKTGKRTCFECRRIRTVIGNAKQLHYRRNPVKVFHGTSAGKRVHPDD